MTDSVTDSQDLYTGQPVWAADAPLSIPAHRLVKDISVDVAIIGAGISGAMCAEALTATGLNVALFDRRGALKGSTAASTALLLYEIDTPLTLLAKRIGQGRALRAWQRSRLALASLGDAIHSLHIDVGYARRPSLYLAGNILGAAGLREELAMRQRAGLACDYLGRDALRERFGITRDAALLSEGNLEANPRLLALAFLQRAMARGAALYAPVTITEVTPMDGQVILTSDSEARITARHVVYATGYEIPDAVATKRHKVHSTWVMATRPQPENLWPEAAMIWEASEPYLYLRTTPEGRVICGGEDEAFADEEARDALIDAKTAILERKLAALFPQVDARAEYRWAGTFGGSTTGLPSIGPIPGMRHCYAIIAYGGNGITFSRLAAELIRSAIRGERDADADLFRFGPR